MDPIKSDHEASDHEKKSDEQNGDVALKAIEKASSQYQSVGDVIGAGYEHADQILAGVARGTEATGAISSSEAFAQSLPPFGGIARPAPSAPSAPAAHPHTDADTYAAISDVFVIGEASPGFQKTCLNRTCLLVCAGTSIPLILVGGVVAAILLGVQKAAPKDDSAPTPDAPPATPEDFAVKANGPQILLTWKASAGATGYEIKEGGKVVQTIATGTETAWTFHEPTSGVRHCFTVTALNAHGRSQPSAEVCATTGPTAKPDVPKLAEVKGLELDKIKISWPAVVGADRYRLRRRLSTELSAWSDVATVPATAATVTHEDGRLQANTVYCYAVRAENALGASGDSETLCGPTLNSFDILTRNIVKDWNAMAEEEFWSVVSAWIEAEKPSFPVQLYAANTLYALTDKSAPAVLTEELAASRAAAFANAYLEAPDTLELYRAVAALAVGGTAAARHEKINVLMRAISKILAAPPPPRK